MSEYRSKVALITGGVRGIGKSIVLKLYSMGFNVVINGVSQENLNNSYFEELKKCRINSDNNNNNNNNSKDMNSSVLYVQADISKTRQREDIIKKTIEKFGRIDILINNAGTSPKKRIDILDASEQSFNEVIGINLAGPYFISQKAANEMILLIKKQNLTDYKPMIINIASISSYTSSPLRGEYCISKAGISMMTKLYADRLSEYGINVYEIRPGIILTDMTAGVKEKYDALFENGITPIKRWGLPEDIAKAVGAIVNQSFPYSTGQVFNVDGGFHLRRL